MKIGLIGFGTVGTGIYERIIQSQDEIERLLGKRINIVSILVKNQAKVRDASVIERVTSSWEHFLKTDYDLVFEAMNGTEPARTYTKALLKRGIPVISANKKLVATHGEELEDTAQQANVYYGWDAAVCGAVPIVNVLKTVLPTTEISSVQGVLNGTTNYILTRMKEGKTYIEALEEAQQLGYAEEDPSADVEGFDAAYKIGLLAKLCFGEWIKPDLIAREGIKLIDVWHIQVALELGFSLKLLAQAAVNKRGDLVCSVKPTFIASTHPLAAVEDVINGVCINGTAIGQLVFSGPGAGKQTTANSVVEDFVLHEQNRKLKREPRIEKLTEKEQDGKELWLIKEGERELAQELVRKTKKWAEKEVVGGSVLLVNSPTYPVPFATYPLIGSASLRSKETAKR
ncbi:homoserine dehydrogenase [Shouchella patagoniensis]|uniref:homoserine dehydrogenase n=1 Tax=Shouchella patagoniensis TaxID=228576 RepID=UPI0009956867|nr:homoserine dehydrogenase [Shouchella patagoniensis]